MDTEGKYIFNIVLKREIVEMTLWQSKTTEQAPLAVPDDLRCVGTTENIYFVVL